jgi:DASH complex subunit DAD3
MNNAQILDMIDKLRKIEKKMSLVYTFFKASMFTNNYGKLQQQQETNRPAL